MKRITILLMIICSLTLEIIQAQTFDSLANKTAVTTINSTDLIAVQRKLANKYKNYKMTGLSLWNWVTAIIDTNETALLNASNSWNGINNFDGATFNSGSHGKVLFNGDSVVCTTQMFTHGIQRTQASSMIGRFDVPFFNIYSKTFTIVNPAGNDSAQVSYDDSTITFSKGISMPNLTITETVTIDSGAAFNVLNFTPHGYAVPNVGDTIMTLTGANKKSFIILDLPGNITPGISNLDIDGASQGMVIRLVNNEASYTIILKDIVGNDDNLYLSANFTMGLLDYIELMCIDDGVDSQQWFETSRSNN